MIIKHRYISDDGKKLIEGFEGFSAKPYLCPAKILTIGFGHVIRKNEKFTIITEEEAEDILEKDLFNAERSVLRFIDNYLTTGQFDALVSFCYNLGGGALQRSTLRMKINRGNYNEAALEFLKWTRANGRILKGLVRRRKAEMQMFLS